MPKPLDKRERNREHDARRRSENSMDSFQEETISRVFARAIPEPNTGCFLWQGAATPKGYGVISVGGRRGESVYVHRVAFASKHGCCSGAHILHRCDTPACCNPDHLFAGDPKANSDDMVSKGRSVRGVRQHSAKLTDEAVRLIRRDRRALSLIAADYGVDIKQIHRIKRGQAWKHVA